MSILAVVHYVFLLASTMHIVGGATEGNLRGTPDVPSGSNSSNFSSSEVATRSLNSDTPCCCHGYFPTESTSEELLETELPWRCGPGNTCWDITQRTQVIHDEPYLAKDQLCEDLAIHKPWVEFAASGFCIKSLRECGTCDYAFTRNNKYDQKISFKINSWKDNRLLLRWTSWRQLRSNAKCITPEKMAELAQRNSWLQPGTRLKITFRMKEKACSTRFMRRLTCRHSGPYERVWSGTFRYVPGKSTGLNIPTLGCYNNLKYSTPNRKELEKEPRCYEL